ncbi:MAG TPA: hypothetical protein VFC44_06085, partial [Candidatus Saccharimonadales bacterium]|nr:hypothetical protein [Candidatus Saccharimonadales bacterium]
MSERQEPVSARREVAGTVASLVIACVGIWLLWGNFTAQWGAIDDHEIMRFLGPQDRLRFRDIPSRLMAGEAGHWGGSPRYRPSYYLLRLTE